MSVVAYDLSQRLPAGPSPRYVDLDTLYARSRCHSLHCNLAGRTPA